MIRYVLNILLVILWTMVADIAVAPKAMGQAWVARPHLGAGVVHYGDTAGRLYAGVGLLQINDYDMNDFRLLARADSNNDYGLDLYWANEGFTGTRYKRIYRAPTYYKFGTYKGGDLSLGGGFKFGTLDVGVGYRANPHDRSDGFYLELTGGI